VSGDPTQTSEGDDLVIERRASPRKVRLNREARTSRILLVLIPLLLVGVVGGLRLVADSRAAKAEIAGYLVRNLAHRTGSGVRLNGLTFGWAYEPCLQGWSSAARPARWAPPSRPRRPASTAGPRPSAPASAP
jgi:hypothetical protein